LADKKPNLRVTFPSLKLKKQYNTEKYTSINNEKKQLTITNKLELTTVAPICIFTFQCLSFLI
jgi:hypothetical protein